LAQANSADANRARLAELRKPVVGMPAVIRAAPKGDAGEMYAFEQYLRTGRSNSDLTFAQSVGTTTEGGYAVPQEFRNKITERLVAYGGIRSVAETINTATGVPLEWPSNDDASFTKADTPVEGAASAAGADIVFGTVTLGAHKYAATGTGNVPLLVSVELLQDAQFDIGSFVARKLGDRIARRQAYDFARGSGSAEPLGIFYASAQDVSMPSGSVPTYAKLLDMVHTIDPAYRQNAVWLFNDVTAKVIEGILDAVSGRPLLVGDLVGLNQTIRVGYGGSLLGYPVIIDSAIPNLSNLVLGMAFGDFREGYIIRDVLNVQVLVNPYTNSNTNQVAYNAWARADGTIQNRYAFATAEGTT
jgi:HK97 family phage major capsid protein